MFQFQHFAGGSSSLSDLTSSLNLFSKNFKLAIWKSNCLFPIPTTLQSVVLWQSNRRNVKFVLCVDHGIFLATVKLMRHEGRVRITPYSWFEITSTETFAIGLASCWFLVTLSEFSLSLIESFCGLVLCDGGSQTPRFLGVLIQNSFSCYFFLPQS